MDKIGRYHIGQKLRFIRGGFKGDIVRVGVRSFQDPNNGTNWVVLETQLKSSGFAGEKGDWVDFIRETEEEVASYTEPVE